MIADKKMNWNPRIRQLCQFSQQAGKAFWNNAPVFVPEIKHISHQKKFSCIFFYLIQETNNGLFSFQTAGMIRSAEVKIGNEINSFIGRSLHLFISLAEGN